MVVSKPYGQNPKKRKEVEMKVLIPPQGEELLSKFREFTGKPRGALLVECLEQVAKKNKPFQAWLKKQKEATPASKPVTTKPEPKPASAYTTVPVKSIPPVQPTPVTATRKSGYDENTLR